MSPTLKQLRELRDLVSLSTFSSHFDHPAFNATIRLDLPMADAGWAIRTVSLTPTEFIKLALASHNESWALPLIDQLIAAYETRSRRIKGADPVVVGTLDERTVTGEGQS